MANTAFKVENGLLVVGSANVAGSLSVGGEFNITGNITFSGTSNGDFRPINNNYSLGNTTNRWSLSAIDINVSNTATINTANFAGQSTFSANLIPNANNVKLGGTDKRWDLYANNANVVTVGVSNTATVNGTLIVNPGVANAIVVTGNSTHSNVTITSNSTQFFSNVTFDTNLLFIDAVNNRVGVATITPDAGLTVATTANVSGAVVLGSTLAVNGSLTVSNNGTFTGVVNASSGFNSGANVSISTSDIKVGNATVNSSVNSSSISTTGTLTVTSNASFGNNVTISGNLIVSGTTTYVNTATLNVADNIVTLNADLSGATAPSENAGVEINRGSSSNVSIRWNETSDIWDLTEDGANFYQVVNRNQSANATYAGIISVIDSVTNTSITVAASANSAKRAFDNGATAYSNAVSVASSDATSKAGTAYSNATAFAANASNISSGTLDTARLPATANVSTAINVGANVNLTTSIINVSNSTVNTTLSSDGFSVGNSSVNTFFSQSVANIGSAVTVAGDGTFNANLTITAGTLAVNGNITTTGLVEASSDARLKTNIRPILNPLNTVMLLDGVVYDRLDSDAKDQLGFIAQQLKPHLPQVVSGSEEGGYRVSYQNIVALLVEAIKELNIKIENLQNKQ